MDCEILHFTQPGGEGEKILIVPADEADSESRRPPRGYELAGRYECDIEDAHTLPLGRVLTCDR